MYFSCMDLTIVLDVESKVSFIPILYSKGGDKGPGGLCYVFWEHSAMYVTEQELGGFSNSLEKRMNLEQRREIRHRKKQM